MRESATSYSKSSTSIRRGRLGPTPDPKHYFTLPYHLLRLTVRKRRSDGNNIMIPELVELKHHRGHRSSQPVLRTCRMFLIKVGSQVRPPYQRKQLRRQLGVMSNTVTGLRSLRENAARSYPFTIVKKKHHYVLRATRVRLFVMPRTCTLPGRVYVLVPCSDRLWIIARPSTVPLQ
jgi:hypothetical protein